MSIHRQMTTRHKHVQPMSFNCLRFKNLSHFEVTWWTTFNKLCKIVNIFIESLIIKKYYLHMLHSFQMSQYEKDVKKITNANLWFMGAHSQGISIIMHQNLGLVHGNPKRLWRLVHVCCTSVRKFGAKWTVDHWGSNESWLRLKSEYFGQECPTECPFDSAF